MGQADAQGQAGVDGAIVPGVEGRLPVIPQEEEFLIPQGDFHGAGFPIGGGLNTGLQIAFLQLHPADQHVPLRGDLYSLPGKAYDPADGQVLLPVCPHFRTSPEAENIPPFIGSPFFAQQKVAVAVGGEHIVALDPGEDPGTVKAKEQPQQHQGQQHIRQKNCGGGQSGSFLFHGGYLISQSDF